MAADVNKHLDRAKRFLEKNRIDDAIASYLAILQKYPSTRKRLKHSAISIPAQSSRNLRQCSTGCCLIC